MCVDGSKSGGAPVCHVELLEHLICGRRADRPTFRDSHELLAKLSKALLSRKIIWFRVPITLIRVRLFTSKFNRIFLVSTHLSARVFEVFLKVSQSLKTPKTLLRSQISIPHSAQVTTPLKFSLRSLQISSTRSQTSSLLN
mgnify:CR=1 FL=1